MKWTNLMKYCIGMVIGLAGCAYPIGRPAWYSYGGIIAPAMPREYPYAVMTCADPSLYDGRNCTLYLFSGPPAVEDGSFKAWETDLDVVIYRVRGNVWKKEIAFTLALGDSTAAQYGNFVWSNVDLYELDSELLLSASDPLPATDYATTLFEGDVTTAVEDYIITAPNGTQYPQSFNGAHAVIFDGALFDDYGLIRLTVDKVPVGYKIQSLMFGSYVGNQWLLDVEKKDTGGSFAVMPTLLSGETLLLSREPGTYHVKIEKIERRAQKKEPVAYLYNGVRLPALPKTDYLYALIDYMAYSKNYYVWFCSEPIHDSVIGMPMIPRPSSGVCYICYQSTDYSEWTFSEDWTPDDSPFGAPTKEVWTNYDFLANDGVTVQLAASEPVPVYE